MGYNQYIQMELTTPSTSRVYTIKAPSLKYGKFYKNPNKDDGDGDIEGRQFKKGGAQVVASCGKSDAAEGTEGSIEIWEGSAKVGGVRWDNPWLAGKDNSVQSWTEGGSESPYSIQIGPYANKGASIGWVNIKVTHSD